MVNPPKIEKKMKDDVLIIILMCSINTCESSEYFKKNAEYGHLAHVSVGMYIQGCNPRVQPFVQTRKGATRRNRN